MTEFQRVSDVYYKSLEPSRKLRLPTLPASVTDALTVHAKSLGQEGALADIKVRCSLATGLEICVRLVLRCFCAVPS